MNEDLTSMRYKAGYPGKDSMREKAERLMGPELKMVNMNMPESPSRPEKTKMRLYKKGGLVQKIPEKSIHSEMKTSHKETDMKKGGRAKMTSDNRRAIKGRANSKSSMVNKSSIKTPKLNVESLKEMSSMKHGGKVNLKVSFRQPFVNLKETKHMAKGGMSEEKMKDGKKCYKEGGKVKMAAGGVAKIRHGVATKSGMPINKKVVKGR